jgi:hypothetical protein
LRTEEVPSQGGFANAAKKEALASQRDHKFVNKDLEKKTVEL